MSRRLVACRSCARHVFSNQPSCPFCGSLGPAARALASVVAVAAAGLSMNACDRDPKTSATADAMPTATDASTSTGASTTSVGAVADAGSTAATDAAVNDLAAIAEGGNLRLGWGDGGIDPGFLRSTGGVYGPAQPSTGLGSLGPKADVQLGPSKTTSPITNLDRTLAGLRPRFRAICQNGINNDPSLDGSVDFTLTVEPDGSVSAVDVKQKKLTPAIAAAVERSLRVTVFDPPAKQSKVTGSFTCRVAR